MFTFLANRKLCDLSPSRKKFAQGKAHNSSPVPVLLQVAGQLGGHLVERGDMLVLELDRDRDKPVFVFAVIVVMIVMRTVFVMRVVMLVVHEDLTKQKDYLPRMNGVKVRTGTMDTD